MNENSSQTIKELTEDKEIKNLPESNNESFSFSGTESLSNSDKFLISLSSESSFMVWEEFSFI